MALYHFHRVLISTAILFFFGYALFALRRFGDTGLTIDLVMAIASCLITAGTVGYLIHFNYALRHLGPTAAPLTRTHPRQ